MPVEDFTTYTEVDPNSHISLVGNNYVDHAHYNNEDAYLYKDKGVAYFTDFDHKVDVCSNFYQDWAYGAVWMLANEIDDWYGLYSANKDHIVVAMIRVSIAYPPTRRIRLSSIIGGGSEQRDESILVQPNTWYYLRIVKGGTSVTCYIYTDTARTNLLDTLSITLTANQSFRYIYACATYNDGNSYNAATKIENLDFTVSTISGVTRDANGNPLGGCTVWLFRSGNKAFIDEKISDANGNYSFYVSPEIQYFIRAHKDGVPNVFGTTDRNLVGS